MDLIDLGKFDDLNEGVPGLLVEICDKLGFDNASYGAVNTMSNRAEGYATYRDDWKQYYSENRLQLVDPTLSRAALSIAPVDWSRFDRDRNFTEVFDIGRDFGISSQGITVPIRGPFGECGLLSVSKDCSHQEWLALKRHVLSDLQMHAVNLHDSVMSADGLGATLRRPNLSDREVEVLQWTAAGKSQIDIGNILAISSRTVEVHLRSARAKLASLTTAQAVGRGIAMGFIHPK